MSEAAVRANFPILAEQAVTVAGVVAFCTERVLTGESSQEVVEAAQNLRRALDTGEPVLHLLRPLWQGDSPPTDFPPAASILEWVFRRGRAVLDTVQVAAGDAPGEYSGLHDGWDYAQSFARTHIPPVAAGRLHALLRGEASRAQPSPLAVTLTFDVAIDCLEVVKKLPKGWVNLTHAQRRGFVFGQRAPSLAPEAEGHQGSLPDDSAFRPAKDFLDATRFTTYKRLHAALKGNPWIRTRKPSKNRLLVHAGDWLAFISGLDSAAFGALDLSAETAGEFMAAVRRREEEIRQRKVGG